MDSPIKAAKRIVYWGRFESNIFRVGFVLVNETKSILLNELTERRSVENCPSIAYFTRTCCASILKLHSKLKRKRSESGQMGEQEKLIMI
jgi:hypothetical protein